MFEPCSTCGGSGDLSRGCLPCPACVGGRVVSESVIEEMAEALWLEDRLTRPQDCDVRAWSDLDDAIREHYRELAEAAARVIPVSDGGSET